MDIGGHALYVVLRRRIHTPLSQGRTLDADDTQRVSSSTMPRIALSDIMQVTNALEELEPATRGREYQQGGNPLCLLPWPGVVFADLTNGTGLQR